MGDTASWDDARVRTAKGTGVVLKHRGMMLQVKHDGGHGTAWVPINECTRDGNQPPVAAAATQTAAHSARPHNLAAAAGTHAGASELAAVASPKKTVAPTAPARAIDAQSEPGRDDLARLDAVVSRIEAALNQLDERGGAALARIEMALGAGALRCLFCPFAHC
jgi:hypothetical protein